MKKKKLSQVTLQDEDKVIAAARDYDVTFAAKKKKLQKKLRKVHHFQLNIMSFSMDIYKLIEWVAYEYATKYKNLVCFKFTPDFPKEDISTLAGITRDRNINVFKGKQFHVRVRGDCDLIQILKAFDKIAILDIFEDHLNVVKIHNRAEQLVNVPEIDQVLIKTKGFRDEQDIKDELYFPNNIYFLNSVKNLVIDQ